MPGNVIVQMMKKKKKKLLNGINWADKAKVSKLVNKLKDTILAVRKVR